MEEWPSVPESKTSNRQKVADSNVVEFLFCTLQELNTSIVCAYKRPHKSLGDFINEFDNILTQVNGKYFVVGDFNVNLLECSKQNLLKSLMHRHGFTQHVKKPTMDRSTLLNHVYSQDIQVINTEVSDTYYSYHN